MLRSFCKITPVLFNVGRNFSTHFSPLSTIPVTVLSGFLGAGKTTLMNNILTEKKPELRTAVLVNDMADINVDADLVRNAGGESDGMVQLENGCICCTLRDDLVIELATLAKKGDIDHIVVESTGISEPHPVAQAFSLPVTSMQDETDDVKRAALIEATNGLDSLQDAAHLHSLVTVVDCATFLQHLHSLETLHEMGMSASPDDNRPLAFLLMEQVQFANLILVNKTDLVTDAERERISKFLTLLNPSATIMPTQHSAIDVSSLLSEQKYDEAQFSNMPAWAEELTKGPHSEADEYGIGNFTLQILGRPFHAERFFQFMQNQNLFTGVLRVKGCFWTQVDPNTRLDISLVGNTANVIINHIWTQTALELLDSQAEKLQETQSDADISEGIERMQQEAERLKEDSLWHPLTQDRRVELVFIGDDRMQKDAIQDALEAAMLTQEELRGFLDSFQSGKTSPPPNSTNPFANVPRCTVRI